MFLKKSLCLIAFLWILGFVPVSSSADSVPGIRLYAIDCGRIDVRDLGMLFSDTGEFDGKTGTLSDPCFLIHHPKGTLIWDTGLGDKLADQKDGLDIPQFGVHFRVTVKLADQLKELGLAPSDITYVAFSHFHSDHVGNAGLFAQSTWIVNKSELINAQQTPVPPGVDPEIAAEEAKQAKVQLIDSDYDVFGDGSVRILRTPGHTPGHQSLEIKLKNSGTVLLSGDLYHLLDSRKLRTVPPLNASRADTLASIDRFERVAKNAKARVVVQHSMEDFRALPKFPGYLD